MKRPGIWESEKGATSTAENSRDNLASLYRPPFALMHHGPFEKVNSCFLVKNIAAQFIYYKINNYELK